MNIEYIPTDVPEGIKDIILFKDKNDNPIRHNDVFMVEDAEDINYPNYIKLIRYLPYKLGFGMLDVKDGTFHSLKIENPSCQLIDWTGIDWSWLNLIDPETNKYLKDKIRRIGTWQEYLDQYKPKFKGEFE